MRDEVRVFYAIILLLLAGIAEIGGGYLIWLWLREGKAGYMGNWGRSSVSLIWGNRYVPNLSFIRQSVCCLRGSVHRFIGFMGMGG